MGKVSAVWSHIADIRDRHDADLAAADEKIERARRAAAVLRAACEADMAVAQWITLREMLGDLSADDKAALLDTPPRSTRRLLYRELIRRTVPVVLTHKGASAAALLRGEPPPPHVIMRAVWRLWFSDAAIQGWFSPPYRQMIRRVMPDVIPPDLLDVWAPPPATVMRDTWHRVAEGDCTPEMAAAEAAHVEAAMAEHPALATCPDGLIWRALMGRPCALASTCKETT